MLSSMKSIIIDPPVMKVGRDIYYASEGILAEGGGAGLVGRVVCIYRAEMFFVSNQHSVW